MVAAPSTLTTRLTHGGILAAGVAVFTKMGYADARVEDILAAAKIARRTFYKYFQSKADVLAGIYDVATGELSRAVSEAILEDAAPIVAIKRALDIYLDYHVENAALLRVLMEQAVRSDSPLWPRRRRFREATVALIGEAVMAKTKKKNDPWLYMAVISALEGVSLEVLIAGASPADVSRAKKVMHSLLERVFAV